MSPFPLSQVVILSNPPNFRVKEFLNGDRWDVDKLKDYISQHMIDIVQQYQYVAQMKTRWNASPSGEFIIKSM